MKIFLTLSFLFAAVAGFVFWYLFGEEQRAVTQLIEQRRAAAEANTVAERWQWQEFTSEKKTTEKPSETSINNDERFLDVVMIHDALAEVEVDNAGQVVVNERALSALEKAFRNLEGADAAMIEELQTLITIGLPNEAGVETAEIVGNYFQLLEAEQQLAQQRQENPGAMNDRDEFERRVKLRREKLGSDVASKLFAGEEAHQRFVYARENINADGELSAEERAQRLQQVKADLENGLFFVDTRDESQLERLREDLSQWQQQSLSAGTVDYLKYQTLGLLAAKQQLGSSAAATDWQRRFDYFSQQRQAVLSAGLSAAQARAQIEALLAENFSPSEREAAGNFIPPYLLDEQ